MATTCEVTAPDTEGSGEQDLTPREDVPSSPDENPGKTRGRKRRRRKARLTGLSQQRQAANARERYRTKSIQDALQQLSCCIPTPVPTPATKLSKIEILRLASQYIEHLTNVLNENDPSGPGASKARPEDDTGTVKTQGSSRARRSRSRQPQDDETVVYLTRRRIKDMKTEDKEATFGVPWEQASLDVAESLCIRARALVSPSQAHALPRSAAHHMSPQTPLDGREPGSWRFVEAIRGGAPVYMSSLFKWETAPTLSVRTTRSELKRLRDYDPHLLCCPPARVTAYRSSLQYYGSYLWNTLPIQQRQLLSLRTFKQNIRSRTSQDF
ncbi:hypothetical protein Bbelb_110770 [Branchiostoma belcheri]|nr:hypothetical protein Bbelb_110770 [Branchiostoma belcheri]